jgi:hypothetical protein
MGESLCQLTDTVYLALFAYKVLGTERKIRIKEVFELQKFELSTFYCTHNCSGTWMIVTLRDRQQNFNHP